METKTCKDCGQTKPLSEYYKQRKDSDKTLNICKTCYTARYYPDQVAREKARTEGKTVSKDEAQRILDEAAKAREAEKAARKAATASRKQMTPSEYYAAMGAATAPMITLAEQEAAKKAGKPINQLAAEKRAARVPVYRVSIVPAGKTKPIVVRTPGDSELDAANRALALEPVQKYLNGVETDAVVAVEVFYNEGRQKWAAIGE